MNRVKQGCIGFLVIFLTGFIYAGDQQHHWNIENSLGITYGHARELVYQYSGSPALMSELVWPLEGLIYTGTALQYSYGERPLSGFFSTLAVRFGFTMKSGTITDRDWLNYNANGYFLTNYSAHDAISEHSQWVDFSLGYGFPVLNRFIIRTGLSASFMNLHWTARDGYIQYDPNNSDPPIPWSPSFPKVPVYGTGIAYWQSWVSLAPTLELLWQTTERLAVTSAVSVYVLNSCSDRDDHYLRLFQFTEKMAGGYGIEPKLSATYQLTRSLSLGLEAAWRFITGLRGNTSIMEIGSGTKAGPYADTAGADYSVGGAALFVRLAL